MKKLLKKIKEIFIKKRLNPENKEDRKKIIQEAVKRTIKEYGKTLKKLGAE